MDCAEDIFLEEGFQAASMSAIAARLGGSKGTLYNYFESKDELFLACVARHCEELHQAMSSLLVEGGDLSETLTKMGRRYVEFVASDETVRKFRMIVAEADRVPEMARAFYETGPVRGVAKLGAYLKGAMTEGLLRKGRSGARGSAFPGALPKPAGEVAPLQLRTGAQQENDRARCR